MPICIIYAYLYYLCLSVLFMPICIIYTYLYYFIPPGGYLLYSVLRSQSRKEPKLLAEARARIKFWLQLPAPKLVYQIMLNS
jgi:hypothetical protein